MQQPQSFPVIETKRLLLREITCSDAANIYLIHGDPEVMRWFGADPLPDLAAAENMIKKFVKTRRLWQVRWKKSTITHIKLPIQSLKRIRKLAR